MPVKTAEAIEKVNSCKAEAYWARTGTCMSDFLINIYPVSNVMDGVALAAGIAQKLRRPQRGF